MSHRVRKQSPAEDCVTGSLVGGFFHDAQALLEAERSCYPQHVVTHHVPKFPNLSRDIARISMRTRGLQRCNFASGVFGKFYM